MKRKTWKRVVAALLVCVTLASSPFHAFASGDKNTGVTESKDEEKAYTDAELRLMSAIIFCEAGSESYAGKVAVGIVVMNRVRSGKFPDTIKGVIYQKNQFSPVRNGMLKKALKLYDSGKFTQKNHLASIKAAKKVLNGCTTVTLNGKETEMKSYLFFSVYLKGSRLKIGHHRFK
jgi:spore germination cell wall hydrolase CwlJ-like protein